MKKNERGSYFATNRFTDYLFGRPMGSIGYRLNTWTRIFPHILFWLVFVVLILGSKKDLSGVLISTWMTIFLVCAIVVYFNLYVLLPFLLFKRRFIGYVLLLAASLLLGAFLLEWLARSGAFAIEVRFIDSIKNLLVFVIITSSMKFFRESFRKQLLLNELQQKQLETENALLKLQVNPHFLFNTLNNLYALNLENQERANEMILQLADFLRYQLEVSSKTFNSLFDELRIMETYINLEKIRYYRAEITVDIEPPDRVYQFPPLLLLPIVENSFKYGNDQFRFYFKIDSGMFYFESYNNKKKNISSLKGRGVGLSNVKKRLELIYQGDFNLKVDDSENYYSLSLFINLNKEVIR